MTRVWPAIAALAAVLLLTAATPSFDYGLKAEPVAEGVYAFIGRSEHFTRENGGNIVNTGYIVTDAGVVVIDTGPSRHYGLQMRNAIERSTGKPVVRVYVTHAHPDHFLGNQAFSDVPIGALPATTAAIQAQGEDLSANLYRLVGGWMEGTESIAPTAAVVPGSVEIGGRRLRLIASQGHTQGDLAVYDEQTRTLFAGDLVFFDRAPTTPNADIGQWLEALDELAALDFALLVPGHGPVVTDDRAIGQTRDYLVWLQGRLRQLAGQGKDLNEAMRLALPDAFAGMAVIEEEFERSVVHLYPQYELETLEPASR